VSVEDTREWEDGKVCSVLGGFLLSMNEARQILRSAASIEHFNGTRKMRV